MKKKYSFTVLLLVLLLSLPGHSQDTAAAKAPAIPAASYAFGVKGGADYFRVHFVPSVGQSLSRGYTAGLAFKYLSLPRAGLQVELNYIQRGWTTDSASQRQRWQYLELPLLTHVVLGKGRSAFLLHFGPSLSYLLSAPDSVAINDSVIPAVGLRQVPRPWLYGLSLGIGYSLGTPLGRLQFEGRLSYSLVNALKGPAFTASRYQALGLSLTYFIEKW